MGTALGRRIGDARWDLYNNSARNLCDQQMRVCTHFANLL